MFSSIKPNLCESKLVAAVVMALTLGFASGEITASANQKAQNQSTELDNMISKGRQSASSLSLPISMFEPWWHTMMNDPDASWILKKFDLIKDSPTNDVTATYVAQSTGDFIPPVDLNENDKEFQVTAELPGLSEDQIDVSAAPDSLTIKGKIDRQIQNASKGFHRNERAFGSFERMIRLPNRIESDKAEAVLKNGVLTVTLPKTADQTAVLKKIPIRRE